ncbi:hypothetical protein [Sinomonas atrocyanea]|jgi:hypothetical protein|uniref:hypothetical protein n=1 Tax=Sinomonas atrocyanea TaxID=37927 RepID=UPI00277DE3A8|nr:hypothetical protein [Sinomonas atrocyanea]MDQ0261728.1 hypothetical protein [Sinomonas atrocyanea]MDR6623426.1 hypothetical protein [Sinomonas atrocyanea]
MAEQVIDSAQAALEVVLVLIVTVHGARLTTGTPERSPLDGYFALAGAWLAARIEDDASLLGLR